MFWFSGIASNVLLAAMLALVAWFVQRGLKQHGMARLLWIAVLLKLVTPPLFRLPLGDSSQLSACARGVCGCGPHAAAYPFFSETLAPLLFACWGIGAGATLLTAWRRWSQFQQLVAHARPAPHAWRSLAARLAAELSIRRAPEILVVPGRLPPVVVPGRYRPRMLLPQELIGRLSPSQRKTLLLHELMHIRRGDHLVRVLELVVGAVFWWLPFVRAISRQLRACEEVCCDAAVVARLPQARRDYARLLLDVVDFAHPLPRVAVPQATAMSAAEDLEQRLRVILHAAPKQTSKRTWPAGALAAGLACALLPCGLHYEFSGRSFAPQPRPAIGPVDCGSSTEPAFPANETCELVVSPFCCPQ